MLWLILILLFLILLVLLGGRNFVRGTLAFVAYAGLFVLMAILSGDPIRVFKWALWSLPVALIIGLGVFVYAGHAADENDPKTTIIGSQFRTNLIISIGLVVAISLGGLYFGRHKIADHWPAVASVYEVLGLRRVGTPGHGLEIRTRDFSVDFRGGTASVAGTIENVSEERRTIPYTINVSLLDNHGHRVAWKFVSIEQRELDPGKALDFDVLFEGLKYSEAFQVKFSYK